MAASYANKAKSKAAWKWLEGSFEGVGLAWLQEYLFSKVWIETLEEGIPILVK